MVKKNIRSGMALCSVLSAFTPSAQALLIEIDPGPGLASMPQALTAFNRAANQWSSRIADPVTVRIDADMVPLGAGIIGQATSVHLQGSYDTIRNAMVNDALDEADDAVVSALPTGGHFSALLPVGFGLSGSLSATKANLKALGFTGLDASFGLTDASIEMSSGFAFDFDASDGVDAGTIDFETVAAHEIGHALGFGSAVDTVDRMAAYGQTGDITPRTLDLFRFAAGTTFSGQVDFTLKPRDLVPGDAAMFAEPDEALAFSTGRHNGDGRSAGHWQDDALSGSLIGIMDPTLARGTSIPIAASDLRALDLIGYEITAVPVPPTLYLFVSGLLGMAVLIRRKGRRIYTRIDHEGREGTQRKST